MKKTDKRKHVIIGSVGVERYMLNGMTHREDGPAYISKTAKEWWIYGKKHREDGPAVVYEDGDWSWYKHGKRHREDGPAEKFGEDFHWWLDGKEYSSFDTWLEALYAPESVKLMLAMKYK